MPTADFWSRTWRRQGHTFAPMKPRKKPRPGAKRKLESAKKPRPVAKRKIGSTNWKQKSLAFRLGCASKKAGSFRPRRESPAEVDALFCHPRIVKQLRNFNRR